MKYVNHRWASVTRGLTLEGPDVPGRLVKGAVSGNAGRRVKIERLLFRSGREDWLLSSAGEGHCGRSGRKGKGRWDRQKES